MAELFASDAGVGEVAGYAVVAPERGLDAHGDGLAYAIPPAMVGAGGLAVGERVKISLGRGDKPAFGLVVRLAEDPAGAGVPEGKAVRIKPILERDADSARLSPHLVELAKWIAGYYCCPLGMVFAAMLPAAVKRGVGASWRTMASVDPEVPLGDAKLTKLQRAVLEMAKADGDWVELKTLADRAGAKSVSPVKQLLAKGVLRQKSVRAVTSDLDLRAERAGAGADREVELSKAQADAVAAVSESLRAEFGSLKGDKAREASDQASGGSGGGVFLLHGVTGSGKTEVYLQVIQRALEVGRGAIVLVPEIALTPQTVGRFLARFNTDNVAVLHSGLTAAQRHAQWRRLADGEARVAVGARSAVFAPVAELGLIVVDEEHEHSYKQDQLPRYHARDVAIKRAAMVGASVVLGSATPSLESYRNAGGGGGGAREGGDSHPPSSIRHPVSTSTQPQAPSPQPPAPRASRYRLLRLPDRAPGMTLPRVEIVDLQQERRQRRGVHLMSQRLEAALRSTIDAGGQAILLLNRRGYANYIACPDHRCGWLMRCDHCDTTMVYHRGKDLPKGGIVRCHHCDAEQRLPGVCPDCGKKVTVFGLGVQRVEEELGSKFPDARALRMDSDTMRSGVDYRRTLDTFRNGEAPILLGTQMIAKGLDIAGVRLVGVISGDTSLNMPDFRAGERTFQLIAQVAGRAGRGDQPGAVIVQSFNPSDPAVALASAHDYEGFAEHELGVREEVGLPPFARMARIVSRDEDHAKCHERARRIADALLTANQQLGLGVRIRGPSACPIARIADFHRMQSELLAPTAGLLQRLLTTVRNQGLLISDAHTAVDVDPVSLL